MRKREVGRVALIGVFLGWLLLGGSVARAGSDPSFDDVGRSSGRAQSPSPSGAARSGEDVGAETPLAASTRPSPAAGTPVARKRSARPALWKDVVASGVAAVAGYVAIGVTFEFLPPPLTFAFGGVVAAGAHSLAQLALHGRVNADKALLAGVGVAAGFGAPLLMIEEAGISVMLSALAGSGLPLVGRMFGSDDSGAAGPESSEQELAQARSI